MKSRSLGHRAPLLWLALPVSAGLAAASAFGVTHVGWLLAIGTIAAAASLAASLRAKSGWMWAALLVVAFACAGSASLQLHRRRLEAWATLPPREIRASLRIQRVFVQTDPRKATGLASVVRADAPLSEIAGQRIYYSFRLRPGEAAPRRGAVFSAAGVLTALPVDPEPASFDAYLSSSGVNFRLARGRFLAEESPQPAYDRFCDSGAARFRHILGLGIEAKRPTLAGLLRAMMLGETHELTEEQHTLFMQSGTMHLFAISGLNIAVIAGGLQSLLLLFRLPAWARFAIGVPLLWLFVDITGAAPSAVRAFAMAVFFQAAFVLRRPANPLAAVVGSAALVLVLSPLQLFSASFLMSYVIVLALLLLGSPLGESWADAVGPWRNLPKVSWAWWQRWTDAGLRGTATALGIGLATSLVSMITSVQFFRLLTPGSLVANLVLIPAASAVTVAGFVSLLSGLVGLAAGAVICNHAAALVLLVIEWLVHLSVRLPGAFLAATFRAPWIGPAALAALTAALLAGYASGWDPRRGGWWPPFALVGITLLAGVKLG